MAHKRVPNDMFGGIRDYGLAKSEGYPEAEITEVYLNAIFKAINDPTIIGTSFRINDKNYIL